MIPQAPRSFRLILAVCVAGALFAASTPGLADSSHQPAITEAHADGAMLRIVGIDLGSGTPKVTLGSIVLSIVAATSTRIDALLPAAVAPGSYLLTLTLARGRKDAVADRNDDGGYEEFWVTIAGDGAAGRDGVAGPQGPAGPTGATGAKGDAGATGPVGATGPKGDTGPMGASGATGADGPAGATGPAGPASTSGQSAVTVSYTSVAVAGNSALVLVSTTVTIPSTPPDSDLIVSFTGQAKSSSALPCVAQYELQLDSEAPDTVAAAGPLSNDLLIPTSASFTQAFNGLAAGSHTVTVLGRRALCPSVVFTEGRLTTVILRK